MIKNVLIFILTAIVIFLLTYKVSNVNNALTEEHVLLKEIVDEYSAPEITHKDGELKIIAGQ